ncbi:MAG TPA: ribonuclease HII [Candidatus Paceibacterota bacterium]|nr:ribonuclease HII [Candidatus Paceibacterota bacterium]
MSHLLGVDEAGRGPLAGPVAVGLVLLPARLDVRRAFPGVADSKQLSQGKREELFELLRTRAAKGGARFAVRYASAATIDRLGITRAVALAVARGCRALSPDADARVYLDGLLKAPREYAQETIVRGDELVPLISLASIAAKVARDRLMRRLAKTYPAYRFEEHKGYPTKLHYQMLAEHGPCAIHRMSYLRLARGEEKR